MKTNVNIIKKNGLPCIDGIYVSILEYNERETILIEIDNNEIEVGYDEFMEALTFIAGRG